MSYGVDREAIVNTVYLGAAVPIYGPGHAAATDVVFDRRADVPPRPGAGAALLAAAGLTDRNGDGMLEDAAGDAGAVLDPRAAGAHDPRAHGRRCSRSSSAALGIAVDVVGLDLGSIGKRWGQGTTTASTGFQASSIDPAMNLDFWLSAGGSHVWNPGQPPATRGRRGSTI